MKNKIALLLTTMMLFLTLSVPVTADLVDHVTGFPGTAENEDRPASFMRVDGKIKVLLDPGGDEKIH